MPDDCGNSILFCYSLNEAEKIAQWARKLRRRLDLSATDPCPIVDVLEFEIPKLLKNFRFTVKPDSHFEKPVLAVARTDRSEVTVREIVYQRAIESSQVARLLLAHELGHLWLSHGKDSFFALNTNLEIRREWEADEFAAELMMPGEGVSGISACQASFQFGVPLRFAKRRLTTLESRRRRGSRTSALRYERYVGLLAGFENETISWTSLKNEALSSRFLNEDGGLLFV